MCGAQSLKRQIIKFETYHMPGPLPEPVILNDKNQEWSDVIRKLTDLQVDQWKAEYFDPSIMDGSGWSLTVRSKHLNIQSSGINAYPNNFDAVREMIEHAAANTLILTKKRYKRKPRKCPNCDAKPVASILYGLPTYSTELMDKESRGEVVFGGCLIVIDGSQPSWKCATCGMEFYKAT